MFPSVFPDTAETEKKHLNHAKQPQGLRLQVANWLSLIGLYLFCMSIGPSTAGVNLALVILFCSSLLAVKTLWQEFRALPLFWISIIIALYITGHSYFFIQTHPILSQSGNPHWSHLLLSSGLLSLIIAWWMVKHQMHIPVLLMITVLGMGVGFAYEAEWSHFLEHAFTMRDYWGNPPFLVGYLSSLGLCACVLVGVRFFFRNPISSKSTWLLPFFLLITGIYFSIVLYGSQTRGAWIAAAITLFLFIGHEIFCAIFQRYAAKRGVYCIILFVVVIFSLTLTDPENNIEQRLSNVPKAISAMLHLDISKVCQIDKSLGIRIRIWQKGMNAIKKKPIFGWGVGGRLLLNKTKINNLVIPNRGHLHNLYLSIPFSIGLVGTILFIILFSTIIKDYILALSKSVIHNTYVTITLSWLLITMIMSMEEIVIGQTSSRSAVILLLALLITPMIWQHLGHRENST